MKLIDEYNYSNRYKSQSRRISLEKIAHAVKSEHLFKAFREKREDLLIDKSKHKCIQKKNETNVKAKDDSFFGLLPFAHHDKPEKKASCIPIISPNLFYHPYSFSPTFISKRYPKNRRYEESLPRNSYKDISVKAEMMSDFKVPSKTMRMWSYKGDEMWSCMNRNNELKSKEENSRCNAVKEQSTLATKVIKKEISKVNVNRIKSFSFLNEEKAFLDMNDDDKSSDTQSFSLSLREKKRIKAFTLSPRNKYTLANRNIIERNNRLIVNCIQLKHEPTISKDKILITSLSKSIFGIKSDRSYKRVKLLDKNLRNVLKKNSLNWL